MDIERSLYGVWTRDPAFYHLLRVGLHWYASEIRQIAGGTLYVADQNDPVWGFVSDDLLIAGYASGSIAHLLPEAERTIGKFRRPVRSISLDDGRGLVFVAKKGGWKKAAGPWRLVGYASGDWEWVMSWIFDGYLNGLNWCDPGFHAWPRDPVLFHLLEVGLHWLASEAHEISGGTLYVVDRHVPVWGFVSDDLLIAGCAPGPIAHLLSVQRWQ